MVEVRSQESEVEREMLRRVMHQLTLQLKLRSPPERACTPSRF
ncbi:hypothetical protein [uncultured Nostoc sp.]